ncbi:MAG: murein L,D-transpeptidase catalytic domain family protein [Gammaproteobacteria bacterium]|jgi:hypothetical protein
MKFSKFFQKLKTNNDKLVQLKSKKAVYWILGTSSAALLSCCLHANAAVANSAIQQTMQINAPKLSADAIKLGVEAYNHAQKMGLDKQKVLTIIDYSKPSSEQRLWVFDMRDGHVIDNTLVAHGKGSGMNYATSFSNKPHSDATSIGVYLTAETYNGKHGYSMRLKGLDKGYNDNVYSRAVVMHSAWYVGKQFLAEHGRLGRSWGCPALSQQDASKIISEIKGGTIMLAYYPNAQWESSSSFLNA